MTPWAKRPREEAFLLNPAFAGRILLHALIESKTGLSAPLLFVVLPLVLHKPTREVLPSTVRTSLAVWLTRNTEVKIGFASRAEQLVPHTKESVIFLVNRDLIAFRDGLVLSQTNRLRTLASDTEEVKDCVTAARFMGRWLPSAGTPHTVFALLGIRP